MFNKGGSTLLSLTIKSFCNWKGIEISDEIGEGDLVVITRNPINRFFSGFIHQLIWWKGGETDFDWRELDKSELEDRLWGFLNYCKEGEEKDDIDFHYARQGYMLKEYEGRNLKLHQIEYLHPQIEEAGKIRGVSSNLDYRNVQPLITAPTLHQYTELIEDLGLEFEGWDSQFFIGAYHLFRNGLEGGHHKGESPSLKMVVKEGFPQLFEAVRTHLESDTEALEYNTELAHQRGTNI